MSNVSQIYAGVNDNETAKYVSERLGKSTIVIQSGGTRHVQSDFIATRPGGRVSHPLQRQEQQRQLAAIWSGITPGQRGDEPRSAYRHRLHAWRPTSVDHAGPLLRGRVQEASRLVLGCGRTFSPGGGHPALSSGDVPPSSRWQSTRSAGSWRFPPRSLPLAAQVMAVPGLIPAERSALCGMSSSFLKVRVAVEIRGAVRWVVRSTVVGCCDAGSYAPRCVADPGCGGSLTENVARGPCEGETRVQGTVR